ncbi:hypothetical protein [Microlunatus kandeliicorticis]|uniref:hypothetical protein n=1 Tax=Microlunatus kandeliicorticis TaxID=1759536 RepID=UPI0015FD2E6E|nr:hypothetical protein [Microlunatus kandeliicorticis]
MLGLAATVLLLVAAVVFFLVTPDPDRTTGPGAGGPVAGPVDTTAGPSGAATASSSSTPGPRSGATASSSAGADGTSAPGSPGSGPSGSGPGLTTAGTSVVASPRSDGSWDVVEQVRLTEPTTTLRLAVPRISRLGGDFGGQRATVTDLQASADGQAVLIDRRGSGWQLEAPSAGRDFQLRYVLGGVTVRSVPSTAGRALAALAPLSRPTDGSDDVQVTAVGTDVHSVQCPLLSGDGQLCQQGSGGDRWTTRALPRDEALVVVQFDLPAPQ